MPGLTVPEAVDCGGIVRIEFLLKAVRPPTFLAGGRRFEPCAAHHCSEKLLVCRQILRQWW